jgi:hypothetical protein
LALLVLLCGGRSSPARSSRADPHQAAQLAQTGRALGVVSALGRLALVAVSLARVSRILRLPSERWLFLHRLTGLLVWLALVHGWHWTASSAAPRLSRPST